MIFSCLLLLFLLLFFIIIINANEQYHIGTINHNIQWHIYCPQNNTQIINPPLNDQPLITYQCPYGSLPIDIVPIEVDFTFICRLESRLIWIMVDIYQYNDWLWSENIEQLNISIELNQKLQIKDYKSEINNYKNRFIIINAFFIPFEYLEILSNKNIEIFIRINQCKFFINDNSTWNDTIHKNCNTNQSKTLNIQYAQCDFLPKSIPNDTNHNLQVDDFDDNTTNIPDFHVILSIDQQQPIEITTTTTTTTTTRILDYYLSFDERYQKILSTLTVITRASNLITLIFIFTIITLILLIIFFIYILFYHHHIRSNQKSSLLI